MKSVVFIAIALLLAGLCAAIGLPNERRFTKTIDFDLGCGAIWSVYTDIESQDDWRAGVDSVEMIASGSTRSWVERPKNGPPVTFREVASVRDRSIALQFDAPGYFAGSYNAEFEPRDPGCQGTFTESVLLQGLPTKVLSYLFFNPEGAIDLYAKEAAAEALRRR